MLKRTPVLIAVFLLATAPTFAIAQASSHAINSAPAAVVVPTDTQSAAGVRAIDKKDPVVCQRQQEIGSLLHAKKVCMTKSQWDAQRQSNRENIERSQIQRGMDSAH